jgi:hypothetical protein
MMRGHATGEVHYMVAALNNTILARVLFGLPGLLSGIASRNGNQRARVSLELTRLTIIRRRP